MLADVTDGVAIKVSVKGRTTSCDFSVIPHVSECGGQLKLTTINDENDFGAVRAKIAPMFTCRGINM